MIFKQIADNVFEEIEWKDDKTKFDHEEIPSEELWEDGELNAIEVQQKIINHTMHKGDWILVRRIDK